MATRRTQRPTRAHRTVRQPLAPARRPHPLNAPDRWVIERVLRTLEHHGVPRATVRRALITVGWLALFIAFLAVAGGRW